MINELRDAVVISFLALSVFTVVKIILKQLKLSHMKLFTLVETITLPINDLIALLYRHSVLYNNRIDFTDYLTVVITLFIAVSL